MNCFFFLLIERNWSFIRVIINILNERWDWFMEKFPNIYEVCLFFESRIARLIFSYIVVSRFQKIILFFRIFSNFYWKSTWKIFVVRSMNYFFSPYREIFYTCYYYYFKRKMAHGKISTRNIYKVCLFSRIVRLIFSYTVCSRFPKIVLLSSNIYWKSAWKIFKLNVLLSFVS